jgi:cysteine desulfurase
MNDSVIYMDHNATTPVDPQVLDAMLPYFSQQFGNSASRTHFYGHAARTAVEAAREQVATLLGAMPNEIIWTSGATESNNLALFGVARQVLPRPCHLITQITEHSAILDACQELERLGATVTMLPVDANGRISLDELKAAIRPETALVSIMTANNEIGTVQPIREIGQICQEAGILFHTDATQAVGRLPIHVFHDGIHLLSLSAHKFYGPKGAGALYIRSNGPSVHLHPLLFGGGHERGLRSGTINVPGIVGLGEACELSAKHMNYERSRLERLRDRLEQGIEKKVPDVRINARSPHRMPHVTNVAFRNVDGNALLHEMYDVALSVGSACSSWKVDSSHVLNAIGLDPSLSLSSIRFSLGRSNDEEQVDYVVNRIGEFVEQLRRLRPANEAGAKMKSSAFKN